MADQGLDGFVVPHEDEHQNEYLPAANDRLAWATGFTGSAGAAVILKDRAALFVDGRYSLQGATRWTWACSRCATWSTAVCRPISRRPGRARSGLRPVPAQPRRAGAPRAAAAKAGAKLKPVAPIRSTRRGAQRPAQPRAPVVPHPLEFSGEESAAKRARVGKPSPRPGASGR